MSPEAAQAHCTNIAIAIPMFTHFLSRLSPKHSADLEKHLYDKFQCGKIRQYSGVPVMIDGKKYILSAEYLDHNQQANEEFKNWMDYMMRFDASKTELLRQNISTIAHNIIVTWNRIKSVPEIKELVVTILGGDVNLRFNPNTYLFDLVGADGNVIIMQNHFMSLAKSG